MPLLGEEARKFAPPACEAVAQPTVTAAMLRAGHDGIAGERSLGQEELVGAASRVAPCAYESYRLERATSPARHATVSGRPSAAQNKEKYRHALDRLGRRGSPSG